MLFGSEIQRQPIRIEKCRPESDPSFSRFLGAIGAVILIYQLMLRLGMPPNAVIAFSAVPGLAVGLGGARLLGNVCRNRHPIRLPVRVGEFCKSAAKWVCLQIGLRSIDMITLSGRITIRIKSRRNYKNYSDRQHQLGNRKTA